MIYLTQLIFLLDGQEATFLEFEDFAIPLMEKYSGKMIYRIRPTSENFISPEGDLPYEIHFLSFDSEEEFNRFMKDDSRQEFLHLKEASIRSTLLVKGVKL